LENWYSIKLRPQLVEDKSVEGEDWAAKLAGGRPKSFDACMQPIGQVIIHG